MDESTQIKHNYTREISGPDGKVYTARKDPKFSFWTLWRGVNQYPGQFTSLALVQNEVLNISNNSSKKKKVVN